MFDSITRLFRRPKTPAPSLTDPLFGDMVYVEPGRCWVAKIEFGPAEQNIELIVDADESGPTESQREFYRTVVARWPEIQESIGKALFGPIKKWAKEDFDEERPWNYFSMEGLRVPSLMETPVEWAVSFWCFSVKHHFDVQMLEWSADGVSVSRK